MVNSIDYDKHSSIFDSIAPAKDAPMLTTPTPLYPTEEDALSERRQNCGSDSAGVKRTQDCLKSELNLLSVNKSDTFSRSRFGFHAWLKEENSVLAEKYRVCGQVGFEFECGSCGKNKFVPKSCGIRGCSVCGKYQYQRLHRRYQQALATLPQQNLRKVELTGGHIPITKEGLKAWYDEACKVLDYFWGSWVAGLEVSPTGSVHLHAITSGSYVGQAALSKKAGEILGTPIVWISRNTKVRYLIKDLAKTPDFNSEDMRIRYFLATRGLRMFRTRGLLYGLGEDIRTGGHFCDDCGGVMKYVGEVIPSCAGHTPPPVADWVMEMEKAAGVNN